MIVRIAVAAILAQLFCVGLIAGDVNSNKSAPAEVYDKVPPQPPVTPPTSTLPPITTHAPNPPPTNPTTAKPTNATTVAPKTTTSTVKPTPTPAPNSTTTTPPSSTPTPKPDPTPPNTSTHAPVPGPTTPPPKPDRKFDAYSFLGGFALCLGLVAIGFLSWKFYISRQENYYHTL